MSLIYIDLETIPVQAPDIIAELTAGVDEKVAAQVAAVKAPSNYKDAAKIEEYVVTARDAIMAARDAQVREAIEKTSFDGTYGQICTIGYAVEDDPAQTIAVRDLNADAEADMLDEFWSRMRTLHSTSGRRPTVVGHNAIAFDLPYLYRRSVIRCVQQPSWWPRNPKPWSDLAADTMLMWAGDRGTIGLDRLARALGIAGKTAGMTGADVWPMVQAGRIDDVAAYCRADVEVTRAIYRRLAFL